MQPHRRNFLYLRRASPNVQSDPPCANANTKLQLRLMQQTSNWRPVRRRWPTLRRHRHSRPLQRKPGSSENKRLKLLSRKRRRKRLQCLPLLHLELRPGQGRTRRRPPAHGSRRRPPRPLLWTTRTLMSVRGQRRIQWHPPGQGTKRCETPPAPQHTAHLLCLLTSAPRNATCES